MGLRLPLRKATPKNSSSMTTYDYHVAPLHVSYASTTLRHVSYVPTTSLGPRVSLTACLSNHASHLMSLNHHVP
jgi:hypothetical protein